jgi:SAM-dependent methyltransferase
MNFTPSFPWFPNIEIYIIRNSIFGHIQKSIPHCKGKLLDVGCGIMPYRDYIKKESAIEEYISMDLPDSDVYKTVKPDLIWDGYHIPLGDASVDTILLTEVLEHCPEPAKVLAEVNRVLKPGGNIIFSVPFIWYLHETPWDFYRYTPYAIRKLFEDQQLSMTRLETYGNKDRAFLHTYFMWLKRGGLPKILRFGIYLLSLPFILLCLALSSKRTETEFKEGHIFVGITGVATK